MLSSEFPGGWGSQPCWDEPHVLLLLGRASWVKGQLLPRSEPPSQHVLRPSKGRCPWSPMGFPCWRTEQSNFSDGPWWDPAGCHMPPSPTPQTCSVEMAPPVRARVGAAYKAGAELCESKGSTVRRAPGLSPELSLRALPGSPRSLQLRGAREHLFPAFPPPFLKLGGPEVQRPSALHGGGRGNTD